MKSSYSRGVMLCIIATASWGGMFPVMTHALRRIDPFTFTCMRYTIAGAVFLCLLLAREGKAGLNLRGERIWLAWIFGTAGFLGFQFLVFYGQKLAGPQGALTASIMMATQPMLGFLVNWVVRRVRPPLGVLGFVLLSFSGIILVITKGHVASLFSSANTFGPDGLIVLGCLCWVIYTVGAAFFPHWSPVKYTTVTTGLGMTSTFVFTGILLATGSVTLPSGGAVVAVIPELAYMAFVAGVIGVLCWNVGNKILTPLNGVLFMDVVPITSFSISAAEGVIPANWQIVGACITALALILNNLYLRHRMGAPAQKPAPVVVAPPVGSQESVAR
jgi:drug/metabolite transporter (DMT)-like permease